MYELIINELERNGVTIDSMTDILVELQKPYIPTITRDVCAENIRAILKKREAQYAILTGLEIDRIAQEGLLREPIASIILKDEGRYGIDEILATAITNIYGSIGLTNFGYLDKTKPGIIGKLDSKTKGICRTFLDDLVCAIIAAAASRLAHS